MSNQNNELFKERRNEWVAENFPSGDQILDDENGSYVNTMDEEGKVTKNYLPADLQFDYQPYE